MELASALLPKKRFLKIAAITGALYAGWKFLSEAADEEHTYKPVHGCTARGQRGAIIGPQFFKNSENLLIFWRSWVPDQPRALVILCHGFAEHPGRYEHVANALKGRGFAVYALDHQGHGASEGDRAHVKRFADYVKDVLQFTELAKVRHHTGKFLYLLHVRAPLC